MADSAVQISAGSGTPIRVLTALGAGSADQQVMTLADSAGNLLGTAAAPFPVTVRGLLVATQTMNVTAATPVTGTGLDVSAAGNVTFVVKNTVAATAFTGAPVIVFEQSDDNVSWGPLPVVRADTGGAASTVTLGAGTANGEIAFDAGVEGINWVRARVTTAQTANGMTIVIDPGGMAFSPSVAISGMPTSVTPTVTGVAASAASVTVLAANPARKLASVINDSTSAILYLRLGTTAATTGSGGYTLTLAAGAYYEVPLGYVGGVTGIWSAATGFANVTEVV